MSHNRPTILVADGNRTNREVIARRLGECGYAVALAEGGPEALGLVAGRRFDLALIDIGLPGLVLLQDLRGAADTVRLPVIMLTGRSDPAAAVQALAGGADDHIAKPFDFDLLAARIDRLLARSHGEGKRSTRTPLVGRDRAGLVASVQALSDQMERLAATI